MLKRNDFISQSNANLFTEDENLIDTVLDHIEIDGESFLDLFYVSEFYSNIQVDFGGGVMAITCRDVIEVTNQDGYVLREQLGLRNTKQNNAICQQAIDLCVEEVSRSGYLF